jgi:hypothetical protein
MQQHSGARVDRSSRVAVIVDLTLSAQYCEHRCAGIKNSKLLLRCRKSDERVLEQRAAFRMRLRNSRKFSDRAASRFRAGRFCESGRMPRHSVWHRYGIGLDRKNMKQTKMKWFSKPQKHDYPAAQSYLSLTFEPKVAKNLTNKLKRAKMTEFAAKDIFRASGLSLLGVSDSHVQKDRTQIIRDESLSPLLLCRHEKLGKLIIADGYHRMCAVYTFDEDAIIPCKIV